MKEEMKDLKYELKRFKTGDTDNKNSVGDISSPKTEHMHQEI